MEPEQKAHRAQRATEEACSASKTRLVALKPIRNALGRRIRYFWRTLDLFWSLFWYFVFSSKLSIFVELWRVFGSKSLILQAFCRTTAPRELQKKANVVRNRADTSLKPFLGGF